MKSAMSLLKFGKTCLTEYIANTYDGFFPGKWHVHLRSYLFDRRPRRPASERSHVVCRNHYWKNTGSFSATELFITALGYAALGNFILYQWGRHGARQWLKTHGHKFLLPEKRLQKFEKFFAEKHGARTVFLVSMVTNVRPYMALMAGSSGMKPWHFFPLNILGIICWAGGTVILGHFFGEAIWQFIEPYWEIILIGTALILFLKFYGKRIFLGKK